MVKEIQWPNGKLFAFTIVDDTDGSTLKNIKPIYDFLYSKSILTTKTVWCYPPRDEYKGESLSDDNYQKFIAELAKKGFEIAFHGAGSGEFQREEIIEAFDIFKKTVGYYPQIHINHASNRDCIYWVDKRFTFPLNKIYKLIKKLQGIKDFGCWGEDEGSPFFWGDYSKKHIKYIRNRVFSGLNTQRYDKIMPYKVKGKEYSNFWFSSSDGYDCKTFNRLLSNKNIDKLVKSGGYAIVYTHFAYDFFENGKINEDFIRAINYLSSQNGWFVPASELLDYINQQRGKDIYINILQSFIMDFIWLWERILRQIRRKLENGSKSY